MTTRNTRSVPGGSSPVRRRLRDEDLPPQLWKISAPTNFEELVARVTDWQAGMFFPMVGVPYAYMEFPIETGDGPGVGRWVYQVLCWNMLADHAIAEPRLVAHLWSIFTRLRMDFATQYGGMQPLIVWRRTPEMERNFDQGTTRFYFRFAIPGLNLIAELRPEFQDDRLMMEPGYHMLLEGT